MSGKVDFGDMGLTRAQDAEVREVLSKWDFQRRRLADAQIRLAAKENGERRAIALSDGNTGQVQMQVHPASYHYWGNRLGYECWDDPNFVREYLRDNPECRVKTHASKIQVLNAGVPGEAAQECKVKFRKVWATEEQKAGSLTLANA
jgi:hypothetical protein